MTDEHESKRPGDDLSGALRDAYIFRDAAMAREQAAMDWARSARRWHRTSKIAAIANALLGIWLLWEVLR